jgi:hypothetical protein
MSPSRFQVLPEREMPELRVTLPQMIHWCSVASSRQVSISPLGSRTSQLRSLPPRARARALDGVIRSGRDDCGPDGSSPMSSVGIGIVSLLVAPAGRSSSSSIGGWSGTVSGRREGRCSCPPTPTLVIGCRRTRNT